MPETPLPAYVDARKAFSQNASVSGFLELKKLERTAACLADDSGRLQAELHFSTDSGGRRRIGGHLSAVVQLTCQRCLEPVAVDLDEDFDLVLVPDETAAGNLDKEYDPWICADHRIVLAELLDEQILLGMPIVSYHRQGPCAEAERLESGSDEAQESDVEKRANSPFAVLAELQKTDLKE
ncbi:MAG: DUF177 domain-containing protein [Pseudomonadales bacterium]|nr:DUF177 domain-containing protein [Pseudomonadales bacterium]